MSTVILGSGIIGLSTAYYLSAHQPPSSIHLVDPAPRLFSSASGFAAGFLACDWHRPQVAPLAALSFAEHARLAAAHDGPKRWAFAASRALSYDLLRVDAPGASRGEDWLLEGTSRALASSVDGRRDGDADAPRWWRRRDGDAVSVVDESGTAIVDPLKLCRFLLAECEARGVRVHHPAEAVAVATDDSGTVAGVRIRYAVDARELTIPATRVLLSAGAWTPAVFRALFPDSRVAIPVSSLAGHSLVVRAPDGTHDADADTTHAVFCALPDFAPEIFSRPEGVIYVAGLNSATLPLPAPTAPAVPIPGDMEVLRGAAEQLIAAKSERGGGGGRLEVLREALCFRPVTDRGTPLVGRIADELLGDGVATCGGPDGGVFLAVGHGPWGISLSLGTGKVMAELMQGRPLSADISALGLL